jgi:hypothetical protein
VNAIERRILEALTCWQACAAQTTNLLRKIVLGVFMGLSFSQFPSKPLPPIDAVSKPAFPTVSAFDY